MEKSSNADNKRVQAIKRLMQREGLKQIDLADALNMEPQNFSRIMKTGKVSEKTCQKIHDLYPEYRIEWLLGFSNEPTENDVISNYFRMKNLVADGMWAIIEKSLNKQGKSLRFNHRQNQHVDATQRLHADCYYTIVDSKIEEELKRLTALQMVEFEEKIQEYTDFLTERYMKNRMKKDLTVLSIKNEPTQVD